ncbi:hypothetical protein ASPACDRAFT_52320 [Aspergillus aculeatus ATCC 16872]|uniref:PRISE-like Rossmann-fold domain-containing protein n=1 Tax=Aspergillus aculeatus (strain ATCC 16872 / CBS 172.66 / WB 5094) TaxID=690307 RepID=A0A1L9WUR0_ASPA1|nr:uncharacterized protein ASPACDRAFT_52320 [Aspergillus aculeatus ATCC 16872]OJJ99637.1 hypothetical protein ASPACDRAFT_52320 [Aspergillus aculeatus ATCC 16872]
MTTPPNHALVFGASGIVGWAFVNELLNSYPSPNTFSRITAFTNRPLSPEISQWPRSNKLQLISNLDLIHSDPTSLSTFLQSHVPDLGTVTTIYFCAYIFSADPATETSLNIHMLRTTVQAIEPLCPNFRMLVLPTGVKAYGVHLLTSFPFASQLPLRESHPPLPEPHATQLFYTHQHALLQKLSASKKWSYVDLRPDIVVGFVPNNNQHSLAQWLALYLSLYRYIHGVGAEVSFPGTSKSWIARAQDSSQDVIARFGIFLSLQPEKVVAGQSFNVADTKEPGTWEGKWGVLCEYFGLVGVEPEEREGLDPAEFLERHKDERGAMEREYGLKGGHGTVEDGVSLSHVPGFLMKGFDFDRPLDLGKMRGVWGDAAEERDARATWWAVFDRYKAAGIIPDFES